MGRIVPRLREKTPRGARFYLKKLYYDTALSTSPYALCSLQELVEPSQILFGSDYAFASETVIEASVKGLKEHDGFNDKTRKMIDCENALSLFPRLR